MNDKELADQLRQKHIHLFGRPADPATLRRWIRQAKSNNQPEQSDPGADALAQAIGRPAAEDWEYITTTEKGSAMWRHKLRYGLAFIENSGDITWYQEEKTP